jgi:hypothetical protein
MYKVLITAEIQKLHDLYDLQNIIELIPQIGLRLGNNHKISKCTAAVTE